jgi:hypothetical protein
MTPRTAVIRTEQWRAAPKQISTARLVGNLSRGSRACLAARAATRCRRGSGLPDSRGEFLDGVEAQVFVEPHRGSVDAGHRQRN